MAALDDRPQVILHEGAEHDRPRAVGDAGRIDPPYGFLCLVNGGDKWQSHLSEFEAFELRKQAVPHRFGGHAGLVRDEKNGSSVHPRDALHGRRPQPAVFHLSDATSKRRLVSRCTIPFAELGRHDVATVGGKNSSLGEMIAKLAALDVSRARRLRHDCRRLPRVPRPRRPRRTHQGRARRARRGRRRPPRRDRRPHPRLDPLDAVPARLEQEIVAGYVAMCEGGGDVAVAVRSSATAEDLPEASFAGQQETLLNVRGARHVVRPCTRSSPRCSTTARSPIACTRASTIRWSRSPPASSTWCAATSARAASCSRSTPTPASVTSCSSPHRGASARPWSRARSIRTSSTSTSRRCAPATTRSCAGRSAARPSR